MSKGYTKVKFIGGPFDGDVEEMVPLWCIEDKYDVRSSTFFSQDKIGKITIRTGELTSNWHSYVKYRYIKQVKNMNEDFIEYLFDSELIVDRCKATTKTGLQCKREARPNRAYRCMNHEEI